MQNPRFAEFDLMMFYDILLYLCVQGEMTLGLLVENCGRVNYGPGLDNQRKGIVKYLFLNLPHIVDITVVNY